MTCFECGVARSLMAPDMDLDRGLLVLVIARSYVVCTVRALGLGVWHVGHGSLLPEGQAPLRWSFGRMPPTCD